MLLDEELTDELVVEDELLVLEERGTLKETLEVVELETLVDALELTDENVDDVSVVP